jgi:hypothetical protein
MTKEDQFIKTTAIIIASFSSRHSWETHKCTVTDFSRLNASAIRDEYSSAASDKWKQVSFFDISEIASEHLPDKLFYGWLFLFVERPKHKMYKEAWIFLKSKMANYSDEPAGAQAEKREMEHPQHAVFHKKVSIKRKQLANVRKS